MATGRRGFVRAACGAAAFAGFPGLRARAASPAGKVRLAFVGVGNQAWQDMRMFTYHSDMIEVVALCDTQMGAPHTLNALKAFPDVPRYKDFRRMFDEKAKDIDAVCVATPDFSHFPVVMAAMALGKAVYCEKPMGNCFREVGLMAAAAARHGVVTQMGNQGHSDANYWQMKTLVEKRFVKDVVRIDAYMCADNRRWFKWKGTLAEMPGAEPVPKELEWDVWQAQRPERPYNHNFLYGDWRCFYEYGTGALGDWGAHLFDAAHEFLRLGLPSRIEVPQDELRTPVVFPMASTVVFEFPERGPGFPACRLAWRDGAGNLPPPVSGVTDPKWHRRDVGAELHLADGRVFARVSHGSSLSLVAGADPRDPSVADVMRDYPKGKSGHYLNFLKAVRGEEPANSPFEKAGPLSQVMALGALAQRLGRPSLEFDRSTLRFKGDVEANALLDGPPHRKGWEQYAKL